jgi:glucose-6-phosphate isomerase
LTRLASEYVHQPAPGLPDLRVQAAGILLDLSRQRLDRNILTTLLALAEDLRLPERIDELFSGAHLNHSENRPALHTALRAAPEDIPAVARGAANVMDRVLNLAESVRDGGFRGHTGRTITDVVHIGIGGSHLGPELTVEALEQPRHGGPRIHFVANIDGTTLTDVLRGLDPQRTLFIIASKSFSTLETRINALSARSWFLERSADPDAIAAHFIAISSNLEAAAEFGIPAANVHEMWDWIGGRYSIWSAVGLPLALAIGRSGFEAFTAGARALDEHFRQAPLADNLPVLMALIGIWNYNFLGITNQAVLPYAERLRLLPDFLQQLTMESNGKSVHQDGSEVGVHTMPIVWGGRGTNGQHAFHQLLHQGTRSFSADFILIAEPTQPADHHRWLLANALAQSQAMMIGQDDEDPHRRVPGGKGTTTIVLDRLDSACLGALLALYEHMVFCQGVIWDINSFDQWGVELGKRLAIPIYEQLGGKSALRQDQSTRALIDYLIRRGTTSGGTEDP